MWVAEAVTDHVTVTSTLESMMSETPAAVVEPVAPTPPVAPVAPTAPAAGTHDRLPDDHPLVTALASKKAELADAKKALQAIEDAKLSDTEKQAKMLADLQKENTTLKASSLRAEIAITKGLTAAQAKRLVGETREQLEADADAYLEENKGTSAPQLPGNRRPTGPVGQVKITEETREDRIRRLKEAGL